MRTTYNIILYYLNRASSLTAALNGGVYDGFCGGDTYFQFYKDIHKSHVTNKFKAKYKVHPSDVGLSEFFIPTNSLEGLHKKSNGDWHSHLLY